MEAFEVWCYRRKLKIPWVEKVSNEGVLVKAITLEADPFRRDSIIEAWQPNKDIFERCIESRNSSAQLRLESVSYTHLDVYNRQILAKPFS